jgi:hypothetical protein
LVGEGKLGGGGGFVEAGVLGLLDEGFDGGQVLAGADGFEEDGGDCQH